MAKQNPYRPKDRNQLAKIIVDLATGENVKEEDKRPVEKKVSPKTK
jgi:hypothetical protein